MNIVYIHGLDSDSNSTKGILLESYCQQYFPDINVLRPDLNQPPAQVFECLLSLLSELKADSTLFIGSSLGGYFASLLSNYTGCSVLLLNPSTQPHLTLRRFDNKNFTEKCTKYKVIHTTKGGWEMTGSDLQWFAEHQILSIKHPKKVAVFIKKEDELLNSELSENFYRQQGVSVVLQEGGDHRFSDFYEQLPVIMSTVQNLS